MRPLIFLTVRSIVNGVRRALTSPQRLIGLLVVLGYWFQVLLRPFLGSGRRRGFEGIPSDFRIDPTALDAGIFGFFFLLSLVLLVSSINPKGGFRPADVDVLFPTPVSQKVVLVFRVVRDTLLTLLFPILLFLVFGRPAASGIGALFQSDPNRAELLSRAIPVAYLLLSLAWVSVGYALSLFVNRSDERSDRNKKVIDTGLFLVIGGTLAYLAIRFRALPTWGTAMELAQEPALRILFFPATAAYAVVSGVIQGSFLIAIAGFVGLIAIIVLAFGLALTQVEFLYDQAAARGFQSQNMRQLQRSGDTYAMMAEQARRGKFRKGKVAGWIGGLRFKGGLGLLWKDALLQIRGASWVFYIFIPFVLFLALMPVYTMDNDNDRAKSAAYLMFLGLGVFMVILNTTTGGYIELLRRVDLQKPLPFSASVTVFYEVVSKAVVILPVSILAGIGAVILRPPLFPTAIAGVVLATTLALVLAGVVLLVTVLFPDMEDATQRSFRGLVMMIGCFICAAPGIATFAGLMAMKLSPVIGMIPAALLNLGATAGLAAIAGGLYSQFNPSE